ncbi:disulfide oxidoreductase [Radiobacillus sp. PE A8.2]|uniref:disulfide oxidoreductase n=1 Tax=Radiobacillus sp. PE A8.2 TaxID=3380349 RepID=UPI003890CF65
MNDNSRSEFILFIIWAQSLIAMLGSLFYSEIMHFVPCELCWYQRILMYPLVVIYGVALWKKDIRFALPGLFLSGIGICVSMYHYLVQKLPSLSEAGNSCGIVPCNGEYVNFFGFVTIPFQALIAFIVIFSLHTTILLKQRSKNL